MDFQKFLDKHWEGLNRQDQMKRFINSFWQVYIVILIFRFWSMLISGFNPWFFNIIATPLEGVGYAIIAILVDRSWTKYKAKMTDKINVKIQGPIFLELDPYHTPWGDEVFFLPIEKWYKVEIDYKNTNKKLKDDILNKIEAFKVVEAKFRKEMNLDRILNLRMPLVSLLKIGTEGEQKESEVTTDKDLENLDKFDREYQKAFENYKNDAITEDAFKSETKRLMGEYKIFDLIKSKSITPTQIKRLLKDLEGVNLDDVIMELSQFKEEMKKEEKKLKESKKSTSKNLGNAIKKIDYKKDKFDNDEYLLTDSDIEYLKTLECYIAKIKTPQTMKNFEIEFKKMALIFPGQFKDLIIPKSRYAIYENYKVKVPQVRGAASHLLFPDDGVPLAFLKWTETMGYLEVTEGLNAKHIDFFEKNLYRHFINKQIGKLEQGELRLRKIQAFLDLFEEEYEFAVQDIAHFSLKKHIQEEESNFEEEEEDDKQKELEKPAIDYYKILFALLCVAIIVIFVIIFLFNSYSTNILDDFQGSSSLLNSYPIPRGVN